MTHDDHLMIIQYCKRRMEELDKLMDATYSSRSRWEYAAARRELLCFLEDLGGGRVPGIVLEEGKK